jgi:HK97 family phage major capsid protein
LADRLIDLVYKLRAPYRMGATFAMNSLTAAGVRKLKDANGQYHWQPGLQAGQPDRLLGFPLAIWEQMDDIGATKFPIAFGNFRRGYTLVDRTTLRITRDNVTAIGFVKFYIRRREGGIVTNCDAIKWLRTIQ